MEAMEGVYVTGYLAPGMAEEQAKVEQVVAVYTSWSQEERNRFFAEMRSKVVEQPADALADLFTKTCSTTAHLSEYEQQLAQIWDWFRVWGSDVRNLLLNQLEEVDMTRVYKFYDELRDMRWK